VPGRGQRAAPAQSFQADFGSYRVRHLHASPRGQETGQTRFTCTLAKTDEPCPSHAKVTIIDGEGASARACPRHAVAVLNGITRARIDWSDSKGLNQWERQALDLAEERSQLWLEAGTAQIPKLIVLALFPSPAPSPPAHVRGRISSLYRFRAAAVDLPCPAGLSR
jgi:hypothetical protein